MFPRWSALVAVALAAALAGGCSGGDKGSTDASATARPTPLAKLDTGTIRIARATFCDQVSSAEVRRALGAKPETDQHWDNGDPVPSAGPDGSGPPQASTSGDVGHEVGCAWTTTAGAAARAWVFARPVTADFAATLVAQAGHEAGCTAQQAPHFGAPALLQTCTRAGATERVRRAGLFGDTWLTCELAGPATGHPRARLDDWCAAVVAALRTS
jgi:hypothetical protein